MFLVQPTDRPLSLLTIYVPAPEDPDPEPTPTPPLTAPSPYFSRRKPRSRKPPRETPGLFDGLGDDECHLDGMAKSQHMQAQIAAAVRAETRRCAELAAAIAHEDPALLFVPSDLAWRRCGLRIADALNSSACQGEGAPLNQPLVREKLCK